MFWIVLHKCLSLNNASFSYCSKIYEVLVNIHVFAQIQKPRQIQSSNIYICIKNAARMQNYDNAHILSLPLLVNSQINLINNYPFIILANFFVILANFILSYLQIYNKCFRDGIHFFSPRLSWVTHLVNNYQTPTL